MNGRPRCRICPGWHLLPILLGITSVTGMIITYIMAKRNCHVEKWFLPYISYTGTEHPESSVFGLILNIEGFLGVVVVILAWRFMRHVDHGKHLNNVALVTGILSCFGVIMVGNFQVSKNKVPHYIGAGLAFIIGTIYCSISSVLTHRLHKAVPNQSLCCTVLSVVRYSAACIMVLSIAILMAVGIIRLRYNDIHRKTNPDIDKLKNYEFTYPNGSCIPIIDRVPPFKRYLDLVGSCVEWLLMLCLLLCLALYSYEFKQFQNVKIILKQEGTKLNFSQLQSNMHPANNRDTEYAAVSPASSLLNSNSDASFFTRQHPEENQQAQTKKEDCRNNNEDILALNCISETKKLSQSLDSSDSEVG